MHNTTPYVNVNITDKRHAGSTATVLADKYRDEASLDSALTTANSGYYTAAMLKTMNLNDKIYAVRTIHDAAGI